MTDALRYGLFVLCAAGLSAGAEGGLAMAQPLAIKQVKLDSAKAPVDSRITLEVDLTATYRNPFDSRQIRLEAEVTSDVTKPFTVPGFLYQPCQRELVNGREKVTPTGPPRWQIRLSAPLPGTYRVIVTAVDQTNTASAPPLSFEATPADVRGMIRRTKSDHRYFVDSRGTSFFPVGANVCWGGGPGTYSYDTWLPKYAAAGCNFYRIWLAPEWFTAALRTRAAGFDGIDLSNAWKLDHIVEESEQLGLTMMFCIDSFNTLRSKQRQHGSWEDTPYPKAMGGPLDQPLEYFTNPECHQANLDRLRYLVARWGYSPAVFAWEFWNEVDIIDGYHSETISKWHREMANALRAMDPWQHLITTSYARTAGDPHVDCLPELDFVQSHHYGARDMALELGGDRATKEAAKDRPHFTGEFGVGHSGTQTAKDDPTGVHLHNGLYASPGQQQAGTPMTWWWDSYVEPNNLYPLFASFSRWIEGFDFVAQQPRPLNAALTYVAPDAPKALLDYAPKLAGGSWQPADYNQPVTITIGRDGTVNETGPLSKVLHGLKNHPTLHNPATFELDLPAPTQFVVQVTGVSGHGGAALELSLDGQVVRHEEFADADDKTDTLQQYNGDYVVDLPAGRHTVKVENTGKDWLYLNYRVPKLLESAAPPLRALGLIGNDRGLVWVQDYRYAWPAATRPEFKEPPVTGARLTLPDVPDGRWTIETWDTQAGKVTGTVTGEAKDGVLALDLPAVKWDTAFRLRLGD